MFILQPLSGLNPIRRTSVVRIWFGLRHRILLNILNITDDIMVGLQLPILSSSSFPFGSNPCPENRRDYDTYVNFHRAKGKRTNNHHKLEDKAARNISKNRWFIAMNRRFFANFDGCSNLLQGYLIEACRWLLLRSLDDPFDFLTGHRLHNLRSRLIGYPSC